MATVNDLLNFARGEIGYSRWDDPNPGTKYGRWYAQQVGDSYYGASGVPYCAMFVSYVCAHVGVGAPGIPGAYCPWIVSAMRNAGRAVSVWDAQPGDIVLFDWEGDGVSDHVGFVESNSGGYLTCIEGNTTLNGRSGGVARRTRAYSTVICVGRPYYNAAPAPAPEPEPEPPKIYPGMEPDMSVKSGTMYRLYNAYTGDHMFTADPDERTGLINSGWQDEGVAWSMPMVAPIYRIYNPHTGDHMITTSLDECNGLIDAGWQYEGVGGFASMEETETPVYRFYNPTSSEHIWTVSSAEVESLKSNGWNYEGVAFYAL